MKPKLKMTTDIPASITTPDSVETRLGTLRFFDGFPDDATVQKVYDNLDFQRGVQAFLTALPAAALYALRTGIRTFGPDNQTVLITESLMDSRIAVADGEHRDHLQPRLAGHEGRARWSIEVPPHVLGIINDFWGRYVTDVGNAGPDRGQGGKYLLLPPGYTGAVPDGYFVAALPHLRELWGLSRLPRGRRPAAGGREHRSSTSASIRWPMRRTRPR